MTFRVVIEPQVFELAPKRVAMDAECLSGFGLVAAATLQDTAEECPLELRQSLRVKNPFLNHLAHENFKLAFHETPPGFENSAPRNSLFVFRFGLSQ
jgi:hypothetical protein